MSAADVADLVRKAHEGEVLGEALFAELVATEADADHRRKLHACQLLEAQTKEHIEQLAEDLGITLEDASGAATAGRAAAASLAAMAWSDCMGAIAGGTAGYRALYADLRDGAPDPSHPVLDELVRHEEALNAFTSAEAAGDPNALDLLVAALDAEHHDHLTNGV
jgi:hypothetical protein